MWTAEISGLDNFVICLNANIDDRASPLLSLKTSSYCYVDVAQTSIDATVVVEFVELFAGKCAFYVVVPNNATHSVHRLWKIYPN